MANENETKVESITKKKAWYENKLYVILWLIFFFPVGIYGVWKTGDWSKKTRWILTALPVILFFWIMIAGSMAPPVITVSGYKANQEVESQEYRVAGQVTPSASKLKINGVDVQVEVDGQFAYKVPLKDGQNEIIISATNAGKTVEFKEIINKTPAEVLAKRKAEADAKAKAEADKKAADEAVAAQAKAAAEAAKNQPKTSFGNGTFLVGKDIQAGTYRTAGGGTCYYERLSGLSGSFGEIITNQLASGQAVVTIAPTDAAFKSQGCGTWEKI